MNVSGITPEYVLEYFTKNNNTIEDLKLKVSILETEKAVINEKYINMGVRISNLEQQVRDLNNAMLNVFYSKPNQSLSPFNTPIQNPSSSLSPNPFNTPVQNPSPNLIPGANTNPFNIPIQTPSPSPTFNFGPGQLSGNK
jgi:hypothetical protein